MGAECSRRDDCAPSCCNSDHRGPDTMVDVVQALEHGSEPGSGTAGLNLEAWLKNLEQNRARGDLEGEDGDATQRDKSGESRNERKARRDMWLDVPTRTPDPMRYVLSASIYEALASKDVVLLKGSWLAEFAKKSGAVLPTRQHLPPEACWEPQDLFRINVDGQRTLSRKVVAVSYCWLEKEHPDPKGQQLQVLGTVAEQLLQKPDATYQPGQHALILNYRSGVWYECEVLGPGAAEGSFNTRILPTAADTGPGVVVHSVNATHLRPMGSKAGHYDFAVFLDWCSLFQKPRSESETVRFQRSLSHIDLWYAHASTWVWMLTKLRSQPEGSSGKPYTQRAWPTFEKAIADILTPDFKLLDLGRMTETCLDYDSTTRQCKTGRAPPRTPDDFVKVLMTKALSDDAELPYLAKQYKQTFDTAVAGGESLEFNGAGWGATEAAVLARSLRLCKDLRQLDLAVNRLDDEAACDIASTLPSCAGLEVLRLYYNQIGGRGAGALAEAVAQLPSLKEMQLHGNPLGVTGATAISTALPKLQHLQKFSLGAAGIGNKGAEQLASGLAGLSELNDVHLSMNGIQNQGAIKLAEAFSQCPNLKVVDMHRNPIGSEAAIRILDALPSGQDVNFLDCGLSEKTKATLRARWERSGQEGPRLKLE
mmetsp:Transcript_71193/g.164606  ORF Transcript_71193/g.164606 Transcript_71193/m.164606 type:complete len:651 (-) Transcript_71193:122-2074(-)